MAALGLALMTQGCGNRGASITEINRNETVPVDLSVVIKGDINIMYKQTVSSHFIVRRTKSKNSDAQAAQVVGTEPVAPVNADKAAFLAGVAVIPYFGDRTYTIPPGSPYDLVNQQSGAKRVEAGSSVKVEWWPTGDLQGASETFLRRAKPCTVVIAGHGTRGTATCPDVTNEARNKHFSLTLQWVAPVASAPTTTTNQP